MILIQFSLRIPMLDFVLAYDIYKGKQHVI